MVQQSHSNKRTKYTAYPILIPTYSASIFQDTRDIISAGPPGIAALPWLRAVGLARGFPTVGRAAREHVSSAHYVSCGAPGRR